MSEIEDVKKELSKALSVVSDLSDRVAKLMENKEKPWEWWLPKEDETYFAPENTDEIKEYAWEDVALDHKMRSSHSVFKTREDAELFAPLNKWQRAVSLVLRELNNGTGWFDWTDENQEKWFFMINREDCSIGADFFYVLQYFNELLYGKSEEIMNKCREILGDEIIEKSCGYFREEHA